MNFAETAALSTPARRSGRGYVDFNAVPEAHRQIDARLVNWGRWCHGSVARQVSPMFRMVPPEPKDSAQARMETGDRIDHLDAAKIHAAVIHLPLQHRGVLNWVYVKPWMTPKKACQVIGTSLVELGRLLTDSRNMLLAKGA